uniref:Secreted protein n=1 Tax=Globodera rostochiensis TaxID=31243 RepID=A0A914HRW2_GLORO
MNEFWILILGALFATNSLDEAESVKLELKTFDEIFGEGWWDKGEAEDLKTPTPTNFGQNVHHQIDRQNTQIGQIEPNSTDQNSPLTESDHSDNAEDEQKLETKTWPNRWKKQFKRQQFYPNSVDSVEEDAAANVQETEASNSGSI